jgi:hypothetical protein
MFITDEDLRELTGYTHRAKQVAQLRRMGIPFFVNAAGRPIVARATIEGGNQSSPTAATKKWEPSWAGSQART